MVSLELSGDNIKTLAKTMGGGSQIDKDSKTWRKNPGAGCSTQRQPAASGAWLAQDMQRGRACVRARVLYMRCGAVAVVRHHRPGWHPVRNGDINIEAYCTADTVRLFHMVKTIRTITTQPEQNMIK